MKPPTSTRKMVLWTPKGNFQQKSMCFFFPKVELSRVQSALNLLDAPLEADDQM